MKANEEAVGVRVEEAVVAADGDVGLIRMLLMVRILWVTIMVSLECTKHQRMESQEGPLKGGVVDMVDLVGDSVGDAGAVSTMRKVQKVIAHAECMIDEVELDVGKLFCWEFS